jgi:RNA polymerase-binding protein DksA
LEKVETLKRCLILFKVKEGGNFNLINLNPKELIMIQKDIEHFKKILTNQLRGLLIHAGATVSGMTTPKENLPDPADRATVETERSFLLRIRDRERLLAVKISKALLRIVKTTHSEFVINARKKLLLNVLRPDQLQLNALTAKLKKKPMRMPVEYEYTIKGL